MDWLTFISTIIAALAWPATLVALLIIIRKELPAIANSLRRVKYKDIEMEFGETAKAMANEAKAVVPPSASGGTSQTPGQSSAQARLEAIAELAPRSAILEAWLHVEAAAARVIQKKGLGASFPLPGTQHLRESLQKGNLLDSRQAAVFNQLRFLRNEAVHVSEAEFTKAAVANYIESAIAMAAYLERLASES